MTPGRAVAAAAVGAGVITLFYYWFQARPAGVILTVEEKNQLDMTKKATVGAGVIGAVYLAAS